MKNRILADFTAYGRQYMRSWIGAFFTFIFPILLVLLFGALYGSPGTQSYTLHVQDLDGTPLSENFTAALNATKVVTVSMVDPVVDLPQYIKDHSLSVALQIPRDFQDEVLASMASNGSIKVNITVYGDPTSSTFGQVMGIVSAVADSMNYGLYPGTHAIIQASPMTVGSPGFKALDYLLPGIVGMTCMFSAMYSMTEVCASYRTRRYFKLLATTTLSKGEWLASKFLWFTLMTTLALIVTVLLGRAVFATSTTIDGYVLLFIVAGALLFTSLGMIIGTLVKDAESAVAVANVVGFPMMFLSGSFFQLDVMPDFIQTISRVFPLTYLNNGLRDAMVYGNVQGILFNLAVVGGLAVVLFIVAARLLSWKQR